MSRPARLIAALGAAGLVVGGCLATGGLLGSAAVPWAGGLLTLVVTVAVAVRLRPPPPAAPPPRNRGRRVRPPLPFPRYRELVRTVEQALGDQRYFDRVLVPLLREIAADLTPRDGPGPDPDARPAWLGPDLSALLDPLRPARTQSSGRPEDRRLLDQLLDRLDRPEERWM